MLNVVAPNFIQSKLISYRSKLERSQIFSYFHPSLIFAGKARNGRLQGVYLQNYFFGSLFG
jgi:hypothetical protein